MSQSASRMLKGPHPPKMVDVQRFLNDNDIYLPWFYHQVICYQHEMGGEKKHQL
jgi:hypothetical protein